MSLREPSYSDIHEACNTGPSIRQVLDALGPRTVEGDQGRYTGHTIDDAIKAAEYDRKLRAAKNPRAALRILTGYRLLAHDGRGS